MKSTLFILLGLALFVVAQNCGCGSDCCSQFGWCGNTADYCDKSHGCREGCWGGNNGNGGGNNGGTKQGTYGPIEMADRNGQDIGGSTTASSAQDCQNKCFQNNECKAWSFDTCGNSCWLKNGSPNPIKLDCRASGVITANRNGGSSNGNGGGNNGGNNGGGNGGAGATGNDCQNRRLDDLLAGRTKPKGVNLGAWFVLEAWMDSRAWDAGGCNHDQYPGSYLVEQCLQKSGKRQQVMNDYWANFIKEDDFRRMSKAGINFVRLPVGWWHIYDTVGGANNGNTGVSPTDYQTGGLAWIDKAFEWGNKYGIGILLTMHAAPGSQGGTDNSSPSDNSGKFYWDKWQSNQDATVASIDLYAKKYGKSRALWGVALMNEPRGDTNVLRNYYLKAYDAVRKYTDRPVVINPLISPFQSGTEPEWTSFMQDNNRYKNVWYDLHYYSCFGGDPDQNNSGGAIGYINYNRAQQLNDFHRAQPGKKALVGEWAGSNHFGDDNVVGFVNAQMEVFGNVGDGFSFWSWAGSGGGWKFEDMLNRGIDKNKLNAQC